MTSTITTVRVVRCPKCRKLLPELEDLPVYECGGCGAVLRAKNRKEARKGLSSTTLEKNPAQKNELEHGSEDTDLSGTNQKALLSSAEESSSNPTVGRGQIQSKDYDKVCPGSKKFLNGVSSSGEFDHHEKEESSCEAGGNIDVHVKNGRGLDFESSSLDAELASRGSSTFTAQRQLDGSIPMKTGHSSWNEQLERSQKIIHHGSGHVMSRDTMEMTESVDGDLNSEISDTLGDISKSPTNRSSYAYDGSVSSYDGWDDHVSAKFLHPSRTMSKPQWVGQFVGTPGRPIREDVLVSNKMSNNSVPHQVRKFSLMSLHEKHDLAAMGNFNTDRDELAEPSRYGIQAQGQVKSQDPESFRSVQNWIGFQRDGFLSRERFYQRDCSPIYENGSSSNYGNKEFLQNSSLYSSDKLRYHQQTELLKKVDELRDQLSRSDAQRRKANGGFPNRGIPQEKHYGATHPRLSPRFGTYRPRKARPQNSGFSHMPFPGDCSNQVDCSCLCCYQEDRRYPVQLPQTNMHYNTGPTTVHSSHTCYNPYTSSSSSPQLHKDSNFALRSHNQRHMDTEMQKSYHRERHQPAKRHFRPIAGGAPFIICYSCQKLLQLPADFLISRKRCHQLQCGACSESLMFKLHNRTHIIPYAPKLIKPLPNEIDNLSDAITRRSSISTTQGNDRLEGDSVSYSEDYGLSVSKSCSTEHDPAFLTPPFPVLRGTAVDKMHNPKSLEERNMPTSKLQEFESKYKNPVGLSESASSSSNTAKPKKQSLEAANGSLPTGSTLHQLMGYSSPSDMINGSAGWTESQNDSDWD